MLLFFLSILYKLQFSFLFWFLYNRVCISFPKLFECSKYIIRNTLRSNVWTHKNHYEEPTFHKEVGSSCSLAERVDSSARELPGIFWEDFGNLEHAGSRAGVEAGLEVRAGLNLLTLAEPGHRGRGHPHHPTLEHHLTDLKTQIKIFKDLETHVRIV